MPLGSPVRATCICLVAVAVASLACITVSLSLFDYYETKSDLSVLIVVPGLCLTVSIAACVSLCCRRLSLFILELELDQHLC